MIQYISYINFNSIYYLNRYFIYWYRFNIFSILILIYLIYWFDIFQPSFCIYSVDFFFSGVYNVSSAVSQFTVNVAGERRKGLQLRGDVLIKCYHRSDIGRETIFACQFHTCAVSDYTLSFTRQELDGACNGNYSFGTNLLLFWYQVAFLLRLIRIDFRDWKFCEFLSYYLYLLLLLLASSSTYF